MIAPNFFDSATKTWNSSSSPCDWLEISCNPSTVTEFDLTLRKRPHGENYDLLNVTVLNLAWNYIPNEFLTSLYNYSKLQFLDLSQHYFVGSILGNIDRISSSLQYLDLDRNNFSDHILATIGNLTELNALQLYSNMFNITFSSEISNLSNLEILDMSFNGDLIATPIPPEFRKLEKLKKFLIRRSKFVRL